MLNGASELAIDTRADAILAPSKHVNGDLQASQTNLDKLERGQPVAGKFDDTEDQNVLVWKRPFRGHVGLFQNRLTIGNKVDECETLELNSKRSRFQPGSHLNFLFFDLAQS